MKFEDLDLTDNILDALYDMHFDECTPVQEKCIPPILEGRDVLGVAQTGTGKTAAYLLPILSKLDGENYPKDAVNCIVMSPTRELAQQIDQAMQGFSYYLPDVSSVAVYGGNDGNRYDQEMKSMRLGADVIIATPGRLISHISMGNIDLSRVSFFVLDEADRMLDMGFSEDIMKIASKLPANCQTIMFSATMPKDIEKMAQNLLKNPVEIKLAVSKPAEKIQQSAYICYETQKLQIIKDIFKAGDLKRVIIFSGSKMKVKQINQALTRMKINSGEMHSDLDQAQRDEMMFKFKSGQIDVLVATDILARGIDIDDIAMVINYDVPHDAEDYVHRIGRTARADRDGVAITFVNEDDMFAFHQIEKFLDKDITKNPLPADCGEGPEYTTSRRPGKTSAKNRRRKDRDNTSHRDTKQRNRNRNNGEAGENNRRRNNDEKENEKTTGQEGAVPMSNKNNRGRHRSRNGQTADVKETNARQENGQERGSHNNRSNNRNNARPVNGGKPAERQNRQRGNKQRQRQAEKPVNAKNMVVAANQSRSQKNNDNNGIGSILRHPLRWIKSLGKK
jgi:superfamily II DNA/RNA helicase